MILLFLLFSILPAPSVRAAPILQWTLDLSLGHDDQILADPAQLGIVSPVADGFLSGSTRFLVRWVDLQSDQRLDILAEAAGVAYGENVEGGDTDLSLATAYRRRFGTPLALDLGATGTRFRRDEQPGGEPVFDQDLYAVTARLGWAATRNWVLTAGGRHDWASYPGRPFPAGTEDTEDQREGSVSLAAVRNLGNRGFVSAEVLYREVTSDEVTAEYTGPVAFLRTRFAAPFRIAASPLVAFGHRSFVHAAGGDSTELRNDDTWQFGITLGRSLSSRTSVFFEGSYLHQISNAQDFEFDETRIALGFAVELFASRPAMGLLARGRPMALAPQAGDGEVRFRFRAPDARTVAVVGGWNAWDSQAHLLGGPDGNGLWEMKVPVPPGIWRYAFVVDGVWTAPPDAPRYEDDGFGDRHGILEVPGP